MPGRHTLEPLLASLLPIAISEGWTGRQLAAKARMDTTRASEILKEASRKAIHSIESVTAVDALALTVPIDGKPTTLGKLQGELVQGAVQALAETPKNPREWSSKDEKGYRHAQLILRDAKALGLIRFGEAEKAEKSGGLPALAGYLPRLDPKTPSEEAQSLENQQGVNDGDGRSQCEAGEESSTGEETREE
jgi:hypothetical protein